MTYGLDLAGYAAPLAPARAGAQDPEDAAQDAPVIDPLHATRLVLQQRLDHTPLEVRQIAFGHDPVSFEKLESRSC